MDASPAARPPALSVISAGIVIADCVARPVERQPRSGELELVERISLQVGGSAASTGAQLVKLGLGVALVGRVGQDGFGDLLLAETRRLGCDTRFLRRDPAADTSATLVSVDAAGERSFLHAIGASRTLRAADLPLEQLAGEGARWLHVAGYHVLPGLEPELPDLFRRATALGLITSLDCVWDASGRWQGVQDALPHTDYFFPGVGEARAISGQPDPARAARALLRLGVRRAVAVTQGPEGSLLAGAAGDLWQIAAPTVQAIDGTGAGDAYAAGFIAACLRGEPSVRAAQIGNAAGARCAAALGGTSGLSDYADLEALAEQCPVTERTLPSEEARP